MATSCYQYALHLTRCDGSVLANVPIAPDWEPACQSTALSGMRAGRLPLNPSLADAGTIEPIWDPSRGQPFTLGFRIRLAANGNEVLEDFPITYFRRLAQRASTILAGDGRLAAGETLDYALIAHPREEEEEDLQKSSFEVEGFHEGLPFVESKLSAFTEKAQPQQPIYEDDMVVFVPQAVLDECCDLARAAGDFETGGELIGRLHRDKTIPDLFTNVTAQIPATHTKSQLMSLTFTPETWGAMQAAISLQMSPDEIVLGWWHSHPGAMLKKANENGQNQIDEENPSVNTVFLSADDAALTKACFPAAYSLALVLGENHRGEQAWGLFGWERGLLVRKGFYILDSQKKPEAIGFGNQGGHCRKKQRIGEKYVKRTSESSSH